MPLRPPAGQLAGDPQVQQLSGLRSLRHLDVSANQLTSLLPLSSLHQLCQLNVEGNQLPSLAGVTALSGLLELYAANNVLADIRVGESSNFELCLYLQDLNSQQT
jgi:Leucine-rich repeat (LRR) protein